MASSRQIEHLERRHKENPEGLTFAPLANAYRNTGQPERAIEILMQGLEHHPNHAPARIVLGRCHLDMGEDDAAEVAFAKVLELDRENVVALKALADIGERGGRLADAEGWLTQLLDVDRNNDEAREQLDRVTAAAAAGPTEDPGLPIDTSPPETGDSFGAEADTAILEPLSPEPGAVASGPFDDSETASRAEVSGGEGVEEHDAFEPAAADHEAQDGSPWEPPALQEDVVADEASSEEPEGPGGPEEPVPLHWFERENPEPVTPSLEDSTDLDVALEVEDTIELRPSEQNEFQQPEASEGLGLLGSVENEFQVADVNDLELRPSESNAYQTPSDAETLGLVDEDQPADSATGDLGADAGTEDVADEALDLQPPESDLYQTPLGEPLGLADAGRAEELPGSGDFDAGDIGVDSDTGEADEAVAPVADPLYSWFSPAPDEPAAADLPADSRVEDQEDAAVPGEASAADFEESALEPPSTWGPAFDPAEKAPELPVSEPADSAPAWGGAPDVVDDQEEPTGALDATTDQSEGQDENALAPDVDEVGPADADIAGVGADADESLMATETMAEVYLSQGHRFEALQVYRVLAADSPDDQRLREKVTALEGELASVEVSEPDAVTTESPDDGQETAAYHAGASGGTSVKALFQGLLSAQPAIPESQEVPTAGSGAGTPTGGSVSGEPTRPAQDPLSLSAVFGEDASPVPPAVRGGSEEQGEGFSFDSFFGQARNTGRSRSAGRARRGEDEEDLDQFHAWLQGLKG
jgi:tetratricopeptide (TPR) repeat protein